MQSTGAAMTDFMEVSVRDWIKSVGKLHLPPRAGQRLQDLMDRNNEGLLNADEREELAALVEWSEQVSLVRGEALELLGARPE